jgi:hypothetical protein
MSTRGSDELRRVARHFRTNLFYEVEEESLIDFSLHFLRKWTPGTYTRENLICHLGVYPASFLLVLPAPPLRLLASFLSLFDVRLSSSLTYKFLLEILHSVVMLMEAEGGTIITKKKKASARVETAGEEAPPPATEQEEEEQQKKEGTKR